MTCLEVGVEARARKRGNMMREGLVAGETLYSGSKEEYSEELKETSAQKYNQLLYGVN